VGLKRVMERDVPMDVGTCKTTLSQERRPVGTDVPTRGAMCNKLSISTRKRRICLDCLELFLQNPWFSNHKVCLRRGEPLKKEQQHRWGNSFLPLLF
jgi:hypothetical protein